MSGVTHRLAGAEDVDALAAFILEHGPNPWNYLPADEVRRHLLGIADGQVQALIAERDGELAGFVSYLRSRYFTRHQPEGRGELPQGYVAEAVVHRDLAGLGIGSRLLEKVFEHFLQLGIHDVYIDRHEENPGSAGMMRKAGFIEVLTYDDPDRRFTGSRRTTLCYRQL